MEKMTSRKISRRSFLRASVLTAAAVSLPLNVSAASPKENCLATLRCPITEVRQTSSGPVQGLDQGDYLVWYGIPYGAAPVGDLRWSAPEDPTPWTETRDCAAVSEVAYQYSNGPIGTEDCLKLDVYTTPNAYKLPVLIFIHGGNNQTGNTQEIPGGELVVKDECVYVALDYRLGVFGFNCLPALQSDENSTGNYTLLDISKALDWVQQNIAQFGGDPDNITISGFSAGGRDVMAMLVSPLFAGRFQKAIAFSGGMTIADEAASASQIAWAIAPLAVEDGICANENIAHDWLLTSGSDVRDWLYSIDSARLCPLMSNAGIRMSVFPHLYGDDVVLPKEGFATTQYNSVPLLMLTGSTEFSMFNMGDPYYTSSAVADWDPSIVQAANDFATRYGSDMYRIFNAECSAETMYAHYDAPIYLCQVDYGGENSPSKLPLGAFHGIFVPMLSSIDNYSSMMDFSGAGYQAMAVQFNLYLKNFLHTGNPNNDGVSILGSLWRSLSGQTSPELLEWPLWTPENKVSMVLDADAQQALLEVKDVSTTYDAIMDCMEADTSIPDYAKMGVIRNTMNGRWFSDALDARYDNPSLWK